MEDRRHHTTTLTDNSIRSFFQLVGDLSELNEKHYDDLSQERNTKKFSMRESQAQPSVDCLDIALDDLEVISTLGVGGFGRVELVKVKSEIQHYKDRSTRSRLLLKYFSD